MPRHHVLVVASGVVRDQVLSWYRRARKKQREEQQRKEMGKDLTQEINMSKLEGKKPIKIVAGVLMNYIQECLETPENERPEFYARIIALPEGALKCPQFFPLFSLLFLVFLVYSFHHFLRFM